MINFYVPCSDIKEFMSKFLKDEVFDDFSVRYIEIFTIVKFEISGIANKGFSETEKYCTWGQLRPYIFNIIKGGKKPTKIKAVISYKESLLEEFHDNAKALFLNIFFENNNLRFVTGTSQKLFDLEKDMDLLWDDYIKDFFKKSGITIAL